MAVPCLESIGQSTATLFESLQQTQKRLEVLGEEIAVAADPDAAESSSEKVSGKRGGWVLADPRGPLKEVVEKLDAEEELGASSEEEDSNNNFILSFESAEEAASYAVKLSNSLQGLEAEIECMERDELLQVSSR